MDTIKKYKTFLEEAIAQGDEVRQQRLHKMYGTSTICEITYNDPSFFWIPLKQNKFPVQIKITVTTNKSSYPADDALTMNNH